ncbi:MAG: UbiA family prenyltransferase [Nitrospinae bacterium]|nr:UbiA family prenyltransferase [Nitrospinota bacterium]
MKNLKLVLQDIRLEHTLFALPFAVMGAFIAAGGMPKLGDLGLIILALFFARSSAMAFNRLTDAKFDKTNPRTQNRPLASGRADSAFYGFFIAVSSAAFIATCYFINPLAFKLSPAALGVVLFYSVTKRFTSLSHVFLGAALSLAPLGAWIAVRGGVSLPPFLLGAAVVFWLVGLDIIYSCQDVEHDKSAGLFSIPSRYGVSRALTLSMAAHVVMIAFLITLYFAARLGWVYLAGVAATAGLLWYEHNLVRPDDLRRVNTAFFNVNGIISVGLMLFTVADRLLS